MEKKEVNNSLLGIWVESSEKLRKLFLNGISSEYKKSYRFNEDANGFQKVNLFTNINAQKVESEIITSMSFRSFEDSSILTIVLEIALLSFVWTSLQRANQSCSEVKDQGLCNSKSIVEDNHCQRSCNRCGLLVQRFNELLVCE